MIKPSKASVIFILVTVFLDMLSLGIVIPVLPKLVEGFVGTVSQAGLWVGGMAALWGVMQFIFSPIQGGLSDAYGRRPVILGSNLGIGLDYVLMALAPNIWFLVIGRAINGALSASISTAYAYIADVTPPEKRAKTFGLIGAAFGVGFVVGPALGGVLGHIDPRLPLWAAAGMSGLNFIYGLFVLPESLAKENRKPFSIRASNPIGGFAFLSRDPQVLRLSVIYLTSMFSHHVLPVTWVLYVSHRFGWGTAEAGISLALVGVCSAIVQGGLTGLVVKKLGEKKALIFGLLCGLIGFAGYGLMPTGVSMMAFIPLMSLWGLATPALQALISARVSPQDQGTLQGANMGLSAISGVFAPIVFGLVLSFSTGESVPILFSGAAFLLASFIVGLAVWLSLGVRPLKASPSAPADDTTPLSGGH